SPGVPRPPSPTTPTTGRSPSSSRWPTSRTPPAACSSWPTEAWMPASLLIILPALDDDGCQLGRLAAPRTIQGNLEAPHVARACRGSELTTTELRERLKSFLTLRLSAGSLDGAPSGPGYVEMRCGVLRTPRGVYHPSRARRIGKIHPCSARGVYMDRARLQVDGRTRAKTAAPPRVPALYGDGQARLLDPGG